MTETTTQKIDRLLNESRALAASRGVGVRCPVCNAGISKWCVGTVANASHAERITLAKGI